MSLRRFPPTARRERELREEGITPRAHALVALVVLIAVGLTAGLLAPGWLTSFGRTARWLWSSASGTETAGPLSSDSLLEVAAYSLAEGALLLAPLLAVAVLSAVVGNLAQFNLRWHLRAIRPRAARLWNPATEGLGMRFAQRVTTSMVVWFLFVGSGVAGFAMVARSRALPDVRAIAIASVLLLLLSVAILAILDWAFTRQRYQLSAWMTHAEWQRERRHEEGDPTFRAYRERRHSELSGRDLKQALAASTVVVTGVSAGGGAAAVALLWNGGVQAPTLTAKADGFRFDQLIGHAKGLAIPIVRNIQLLDTLLGSELDRSIPESTFSDVAAIIAALGPAREETGRGD
ncbi:MAG: EscU/YscU/HrcU family type III secretion system export apparatus switch protein [Myxococcales bacterium]|nr:EscU/YscU/HrcU family type III secretion system export apparatus switch protein [Myxococcales bacterium]